MSLTDLSGIIHGLPEPMLLVQPGGMVLAVNLSAVRLFRRRSTELLGRPIGRLVTDAPEKLSRYLRQCSRTSEGIKGAFNILMPDRPPVLCNVAGGFVRYPKIALRLIWLRVLPCGTPDSRFAAFSERLHVASNEKRARWQNEQRWRIAFENSAIGITMADFNGRYFAANSVFLSLLGYSESELYQRTFTDVTYEDDREENLNLHRELVEGKRQHFEIEKRYRRKNGSLVWVRNNVALVPGIGGVAPFWFGIVEDITERKRIEEDLRLQIQVLQNIPAVAWTVTTDARCDFVNQFFLESTGMSREHVQSHPDEWSKGGRGVPPLFSSLHPQDRQIAANLFWNGIRRGEGWTFEAQRFHPSDQSYHWHFDRALPLRDSQGKVVRFVGTCTDIEPLKRAQQSLRESETRLRAFFDNSPNLLFLKDREGRYLQVNKQFKTAFGITEEQIKGKRDDEVFLAEQAVASEANDRQVLEAGVPMGFEEVAYQEDGRHTSIVHKFPLFNAKGTISTIGGIATDITEREKVESARRLAEEKLRASERSLRELTETIPQMLWSADRGGTIDYCNQRLLDYTGLTVEQVRRGGWTKAVHPDDVNKMQEAWTASVSSGEAFQCELRSLRAEDRAYRWCLCSALPLRDQQGGVIKWFGTVVDLHDWKAAQRALQITQAELARVSRLTTMGELVASIAHEVNQPLTAVTNNSSGCLRLLADGNLTPEVLRRALEEIVADTTRASAVIARVRAFIKQAASERSELDINEVIQEVLALVGRELSDNGVLVYRQLTNELPNVLGDRVQLQQVLLNLLMNGMEAMSAITTRPRVIRAESRINESGDVLVGISDSGTGIGNCGDKMFTPFFTTKSSGMGMGLPISRSLIEEHGGRLWATPNCPHGAVFYFTLPAAGRIKP